MNLFYTFLIDHISLFNFLFVLLFPISCWFTLTFHIFLFFLSLILFSVSYQRSPSSSSFLYLPTQHSIFSDHIFFFSVVWWTKRLRVLVFFFFLAILFLFPSYQRDELSYERNWNKFDFIAPEEKKKQKIYFLSFFHSIFFFVLFAYINASFFFICNFQWEMKANNTK